jgi:hypothetical protein
MDIEFILALDDAKRSGKGIEYIPQTNCYKRILAAMDADGTGRTHEQSVLYLDGMCEAFIKKGPPMPDHVRESLKALKQN